MGKNEQERLDETSTTLLYIICLSSGENEVPETALRHDKLYLTRLRDAHRDEKIAFGRECL
jgi:hypothetical protein